jgi:hypothetical protein
LFTNSDSRAAPAAVQTAAEIAVDAHTAWLARMRPIAAQRREKLRPVSVTAVPTAENVVRLADGSRRRLASERRPFG